MLEQIVIALTGTVAVYLSQCESVNFRKYSSVFGLIGQPFWFYSAYSADQWGIFILCFFYTLSWAKGFYLYWIKPMRRGYG